MKNKNLIKYTDTIMLINEIDDLINKEMNDKYKFIIIKKLIEQWRNGLE